MTEVEAQNVKICKVLDDLKTFLCGKNISYDGSAFKAIAYCGKLISPLEAVDVRIVDKIRRLQSADPNFQGEDTEEDLLGYLVIKKVLKAL